MPGNSFTVFLLLGVTTFLTPAACLAQLRTDTNPDVSFLNPVYQVSENQDLRDQLRIRKKVLNEEEGGSKTAENPAYTDRIDTVPESEPNRNYSDKGFDNSTVKTSDEEILGPPNLQVGMPDTNEEQSEIFSSLSSKPLHSLDRLGGTGKLGSICDVPLNKNFVNKIYERYETYQKVEDLEKDLMKELVQNPYLRNQSCYGYIPDKKNSSRSVVNSFMECRVTNVTSEKGKCRCLEERNKDSTMHFQPSGDRCHHPIDILPSCNRREWLRVVDSKLDSIISKFRDEQTDPEAVKEAGQDLRELARVIGSRYGNDTAAKRKLRAICFTEDFSMVCNRRRYCTCNQSPHFRFVRSKIQDRCVPVNGTWCDTSGNKWDACAESSCAILFPEASAPPQGTSTSWPPPPTPPPVEPVRACGGTEAWLNVQAEGCYLLCSYLYLILQLVTTWLVCIFIK